MLELYHCPSARSFRCLWALEEMQIPYDLKVMTFPPRVSAPGYLQVNALGTVPTLLDGETMIIESAAALQYLAGRYGPTTLALTVNEEAYGAWLNWTHFGETSLTVPLALMVRYKTRDQPDIVQDATADFLKRLAIVAEALEETDYLAAQRFTIADISVHYALELAEFLGLAGRFPAAVVAYAQRLRLRAGYRAARRAQKLGLAG